MEKLYENIKKELKEIEANGIDASNLETTSKLIDMLKNLSEIKEQEEEKDMRDYDNYGRGYRIERYDGDYRYDRDYRDRYENDYGRRGVPGSGRGRYSGNDNRMRDHLNRIYEGAEMYEYGRDRYQHGGNEERIYDGLEKLMYALCMFVESTMEFAETPQEKEIIRKHIQKLQKM